MIGGTNWAGIPKASAEIWDPVTKESKFVGSMRQARYLHTATPVADNRLLVAGGIDERYDLVGQTELYLESSQSFSPGPALQVPRAWHTATALKDGTVLLAGGQDAKGNAIASAEIYNPTTNKTTRVGNMTTILAMLVGLPVSQLYMLSAIPFALGAVVTYTIHRLNEARMQVRPWVREEQAAE